MNKGGRPKKNGTKEPWMLYRSMLVLSHFDAARWRGEKHSSAITSTRDEILNSEANVAISESEVRRVVSRFRNRELLEVITPGTEAISDEENERIAEKIYEAQVAVARFKKEPIPERLPRRFKAISLRVVPRPVHPRINSKQRNDLGLLDPFRD